MSSAKKLSDVRKSFCTEYIKDKNATQAAIRAGYSEKTAYSQGQRLLKIVEVQEQIQNMQNKVNEKAMLTAEYVIEGLMEVAERSLTREPVYNEDEDECGEWKFNAAGANKAFELLGKHLVMFTEKQQLSSDPDNPLTIEMRLKSVLDEIVTGKQTPEPKE